MLTFCLVISALGLLAAWHDDEVRPLALTVVLMSVVSGAVVSVVSDDHAGNGYLAAAAADWLALVVVSVCFGGRASDAIIKLLAATVCVHVIGWALWAEFVSPWPYQAAILALTVCQSLIFYKLSVGGPDAGRAGGGSSDLLASGACGVGGLPCDESKDSR